MAHFHAGDKGCASSGPESLLVQRRRHCWASVDTSCIRYPVVVRFDKVNLHRYSAAPRRHFNTNNFAEFELDKALRRRP